MKELVVCHLYGNLLNTYGDYGNLLLLKHLAKKRGYAFKIVVVSLHDAFCASDYDFVFIGGGQDYEQRIIAKDIAQKKDALKEYIDLDKPLLAICGGYQLLGEYYELADGTKIYGAGVLPHYTTNQNDNRFIGDVEIKNDTGKTYVGFENHQGRTYLGEGQVPLGFTTLGYGNNGIDKTEGAIYKSTYCSYFHGPLLVRNESLAEEILDKITKKH